MDDHVKNVIGALIVTVLGLALAPTISDFSVSTAAVETAANNTGAASMYKLIPLAWAIGVLVLAFGIVYMGFRRK